MKKIYVMAAAALMAAGFTACVDTQDNPIGISHTVSGTENTVPTTDQLAVRVLGDMPTAVMSHFDPSSTATALARRVSKTTDEIDWETRMVMLKGSDFDSGSPLSEEQMEDIVWTYLSWGYIAIERPTEKQLDNFFNAFYDAAVNIQEWLIEETFDIDEDEAEAAAKTSSVVERMQARLANVRSYGRRAAADDDDETQVLAEMVIYGPTEYFLQAPLETEASIGVQSQDDGDELSDSEWQTIAIERTDYLNGLLADAAAQWLNDVEERIDEEWEADKVSAATRRAQAGEVINKIMNASETFTFKGRVNGRDQDNKLQYGLNRIQMLVRSWGVHNFDLNKDYYYIQQNVSLNMSDRISGSDPAKLFYPTEDENTWTDATGYGQWNCWYGSFLAEYSTSMNLTGDRDDKGEYSGGHIVLEAAMPETENLTSSMTINVSESSSHTTTLGITAGLTNGTTGGKSTILPSVSAQWQEGITQGTSFTMGTTRTYKDLRVVKNNENNLVTWTYKGNLPKFRRETRDKHVYYMHDTAPDILTNTADMTNEACWSVTNPVGRLWLEITSHPKTAALMFHCENDPEKTSKKGHYEYTDTKEQNSFRHQLMQPNRAQQKWTMSIRVNKYTTYNLPELGKKLEEAIMAKFPDLYKHTITVADKNTTSLETANAYIRYAKNCFAEQYEVLQEMARDHGIKKFTIYWGRQGGGRVTESFTVTVGGDTEKLVSDGGTDDGINMTDHLFDENMKTKWRARSEDRKASPEGPLAWYVEFHTPEPVSPSSYTIIADDAITQQGSNPAYWQLYGKRGPSDKWTLLDTVDDRHSQGSRPWANCTTKPHNFDVKPTDMQYFRLVVIRSWLYDVQVNEFYFNYPSEQ